MKVVAAILLALLGASAWGDCRPKKMVRVVFRDATPSAAGTFAAKPRTLFRWGAHYLRLEEEPDPQNGIHGLIVTNQRDTWMVNLSDSTGKHRVDKSERYGVHAPIVGWINSPLIELEYGCELEFMEARAVKPIETKVGEQELLQYEVSAGDLTDRLLVHPTTEDPWAVGVIEDGEPSYLVRYVEYELDLSPRPELFAAPAGIRYVVEE